MEQREGYTPTRIANSDLDTVHEEWETDLAGVTKLSSGTLGPDKSMRGSSKIRNKSFSRLTSTDSSFELPLEKGTPQEFMANWNVSPMLGGNLIEVVTLVKKHKTRVSKGGPKVVEDSSGT